MDSNKLAMRLLGTLTVIVIVLFGNAQAKTTITWWQFWTDPAVKPVINEMVADFERANPDIEVKLTDLTWANGHEKIVIAFSSGRGPDVVELGSDWIAQFADAGQLLDISGEIRSDSSNFQGWGMSTYKGSVYAHPWFLGSRVLFVNRELLSRIGWSREFLPSKWQYLKSSANSAKNLPGDYYGWGSNVAETHRLYKKYMPFFWSNDAQIFTDDGRYCVFSSGKAVGALRFYKMLHDSCGFVGTQRAIEDAFLDEKIVYIISGDWLLKRIKLEGRDLDFTTSLIPGVEFPGKSFLGGEFLAVNAASENKEAALKFVKFITSPENQVKFCIANHSANPSNLTAQEHEHFAQDPNIQTFIRQIKSSVHPPVDPDWVHMESIIEEAVEEALFGHGMLATALRDAQIEITKLKEE